MLDMCSKFSEFYSWLFTDEPEKYVDKSLLSQGPDAGLDAINALVKCTNGFATPSKEALVNCLLSSSEETASNTLDALRTLTNTSKMHFQTFFLMRLKEKGFLKFEVAESTQGTLTLKVRDLHGRLLSKPSHANFIQIIKSDRKIAEECVAFFCDSGLEQVINGLRTVYSKEGGKLVVDLCTDFALKGPSAEKRGEFAERIVHEKLISWGLRPNVDFNTTDVSLIEAIRRVIRNHTDLVTDANSLLQRLEEEDTTRRLDIVMPLDAPLVISQNVFYTSNTGGIAAKKADDILNTKGILDDYLSNRSEILSFLGLVDGQGWIDMASSLDKCFRNFDNFFQLKTVDTKFRTLLRKKGVLTPLDVEIATFDCSRGDGRADKDSILERLHRICPNSIDTPQDMLERTVRMNFVKDEPGYISIHENRKDLVEAFHFLDIAQSEGFEAFSEKLDKMSLCDFVSGLTDSRDDTYIRKDEMGKIVELLRKRFIFKTFAIS